MNEDEHREEVYGFLDEQAKIAPTRDIDPFDAGARIIVKFGITVRQAYQLVKDWKVLEKENNERR